MATIRSDPAATFRDPAFTVKGATPADQLRAIVAAMAGANPGAKRAIYTGLRQQ